MRSTKIIDIKSMKIHYFFYSCQRMGIINRHSFDFSPFLSIYFSACLLLSFFSVSLSLSFYLFSSLFLSLYLTRSISLFQSTSFALSEKFYPEITVFCALYIRLDDQQQIATHSLCPLAHHKQGVMHSLYHTLLSFFYLTISTFHPPPLHLPNLIHLLSSISIFFFTFLSHCLFGFISSYPLSKFDYLSTF